MEKITCTVRPHGNRTLEIKADYPVDTSLKKKQKQNFGFNCYLFTPQALHINSKTFNSDRFFSESISYTRYGRAKISMELIINPKNSLSPYTRIISKLKQTEALSQKEKKRIFYEMKVLYNVFYRELHRQRELIEEKEKTGTLGKEEIEAIDAEFEIVTTAMGALKEEIELYPDQEVIEGYQLIHEGLSMELEKTIWSRILSGAIEENRKETYFKSLNSILEEREKNGGQFVSEENSIKNEYYIYREHGIKKWAQRSMHMNLEVSKKANQLLELGFAVAASLAMLITLALTVLSTRRIVQGSALWILIAAIIYMVKDRLKEKMRSYSKKIVPVFASDREQIIIDPMTSYKCGRTKEWVVFTEMEKLPQQIKNLRLKGKNRLDSEILSEDILHYRKTIKIENHKLIENHKRLSTITEIFRLDLRQWLYKMDKDMQKLFVKKGKKLKQIEANRVYHLGLILEFSDRDLEESVVLERYRIVANSSQILRIEKVT